jgi:hypothetical protein
VFLVYGVLYICTDVFVLYCTYVPVHMYRINFMWHQQPSTVAIDSSTYVLTGGRRTIRYLRFEFAHDEGFGRQIPYYFPYKTCPSYKLLFGYKIPS